MVDDISFWIAFGLAAYVVTVAIETFFDNR